MPLSRREALLVLLGAPMAKALSAQALVVRLDGDFIRISAPQIRFISGKILERLHDGASVSLLAQLSVSFDESAAATSRSFARFVLSFDIWEEKFAVTLIQQARRTFAHLSLESAQDCVIDSVTLGSGALPSDRPFWIHFDLRAEDPRDSSEIIGGSGINLTRLVEIFSRPPGGAQPHWSLDAGPLHLADLRNRPPRSG